MSRDNAAIRKKNDKSKWCMSCGNPVRTEKEQRRNKCSKCHKLDKKRWRSPDASKTKWRGKIK